MVLIETLQTALSGADIYYWFASGFGNMNHLADPYASAFDVPIIGSIVSLSIQFFFAYRLWVLSNKRNRWLSGLICVVSPTVQDSLAEEVLTTFRRFLASTHRLPLRAVSM